MHLLGRVFGHNLLCWVIQMMNIGKRVRIPPCSISVHGHGRGSFSCCMENVRYLYSESLASKVPPHITYHLPLLSVVQHKGNFDVVQCIHVRHKYLALHRPNLAPCAQIKLGAYSHRPKKVKKEHRKLGHLHLPAQQSQHSTVIKPTFQSHNPTSTHCFSDWKLTLDQRTHMNLSQHTGHRFHKLIH